MNYSTSPLYSSAVPELKDLLCAAIDRGCTLFEGNTTPLVFFRADDIGVPSRHFSQLITLFSHYKLPLCLATVPSWLTTARRDTLLALTGKNNPQWYWHQHGWVHKNYQQSGKNQEFGTDRQLQTILSSLQQGKERLDDLLGADFHPFFTPPWNRCSEETLQALQDLQFIGLSRSKNAQPVSHQLPDIQINIDLHTRKEPDQQGALTALLHELETGIASGRAGIMIHHQRMNQHAFDLLDILLFLISNRTDLTPVHFGNLLDMGSASV